MHSFSFRLIVVLVTFFVGIFAVSVQIFENQKEFTQTLENLPSRQEERMDLTSPFNPNEVYEVYSAILANEKRDDETLIIRVDTSIGLIADPKSLSEEISILNEDTIKDFAIKNEKGYKLQNNFSIENKVVLINENEDLSVGQNNRSKHLFPKYPKARAILSFSRVGFNTNRTQALVYFTSWCDPLCGRGDFIFLQKVNGKWRVEKEVGLWVS